MLWVCDWWLAVCVVARSIRGCCRWSRRIGRGIAGYTSSGPAGLAALEQVGGAARALEAGSAVVHHGRGSRVGTAPDRMEVETSHVVQHVATDSVLVLPLATRGAVEAVCSRMGPRRWDARGLRGPFHFSREAGLIDLGQGRVVYPHRNFGQAEYRRRPLIGLSAGAPATACVATVRIDVQLLAAGRHSAPSDAVSLVVWYHTLQPASIGE